MTERLRHGFTLLETVIYTALLATGMLVLITLLNAGLNTHSLISGQQRLVENEELAQATIIQRLSEASTITSPASGSSGTLTIDSPTAGQSPITFQLANGVLTMKLGAANAVNITSQAIQVTSFTATRLNGTTPAIFVSISYQTTTATATLQDTSAFTYTLRYD